MGIQSVRPAPVFRKPCMASARKLEQDLSTMTETMHSLVRSFQVVEEKDESNKQEKNVSGELPEVLLEKLILAAQSILSTIADLKRVALLSDYPALNKLIKGSVEEHDAARVEIEKRIQQIMIDRESQGDDGGTGVKGSDIHG